MPYPNFDIRLHLDNLTTDGGNCGKDEQSYHCPLCNSGNFKVNHKTGKWNTWGCDCAKSEKGKQSIKDAIAPLTWDKPVREKKSITYTYHTEDSGNAIEIAQVRRSDDGAGKRKFSQWHRDGARWVTGLPDAVKARVHLYQIFEDVNQSAIANGLPILIVEGEGKVDQLLALGIAATCSIGGAGKWNQYGYFNYLKDLEGAAVVICPDRDEPGIKHAELIAEDFPSAKWLYPNSSSFLWSRDIPKNKGFDIGDWIDDGATEADILGAIGEKRAIGVPVVVEVEGVEDEEDEDEEKPRLRRDYETIKKRFGDRLSYNELKKEIEFDNKTFVPVLAKTVFAIHHRTSLKSAKDDISDLVTLIARENSYNPVTVYLDRVSAEHGAETTVLDELAKRYMGAERKIHEVVLIKFLISAVARAYKPGCKVDTALLLQGKEGYLKSTFFNTLASDEFFDDPTGSTGDKDEKMKFHRSWIIEWAELETVFRKKDVSQVKALLSAKSEILRPPYGKVYEEMLRPSVFCATTNETEVLAGNTGNRRFWVIPVTKKIDGLNLERERDRIWAAVVALYKRGAQWWLTDDEELAMNDQRKHFETSDTWADEILDYLEGKEIAPLSKIIEVCFDIPKAQQDGRIQNRVKGILTRNGWKPMPSAIPWEGIRRRCWQKSDI